MKVSGPNRDEGRGDGIEAVSFPGLTSSSWKGRDERGVIRAVVELDFSVVGSQAHTLNHLCTCVQTTA